jgi:hypothetical protein
MRKNLKSILSLFPDSIVLSFTKKLLIYLKLRSAITKWVIDPPISDEYEHCGLIIRLRCFHIDGEERWSEQWNWYVYDGMYRFLDQGMTYDSASSLLAAKQWINDFMDYDDEEPDTALADAKNWVNLN